MGRGGEYLTWEGMTVECLNLLGWGASAKVCLYSMQYCKASLFQTNVVLCRWHLVDELCHLVTARNGIAIPDYARGRHIQRLERGPVIVPRAVICRNEAFRGSVDVRSGGGKESSARASVSYSSTMYSQACAVDRCHREGG